MALSVGTKLGPYEIVAAIGAGGMGEVYRAKDTRLGRDVAIKVLPQMLAKDADRLARFEQEARVLGALNHPNLLGIFDVGSENGLQYLVSEFLEGKTLRERLNEGALPQRKLVEYSTKIANGLAAAHERGFVHRDLKPENIFVTNDEHVKILDFGLAKYALDVALSGTAATMDLAATAPGTVMGTVGYMSPEQVRGQTADSRSDIFSFGAILYEMATEKKAFEGESSVETMNAILKEEPAEIDLEKNKVAPGLERILRHCLEKNPADRFQSARDLGFALTALSGTGATAALAKVEEKTRAIDGWVWALAGIALASLLGLVMVLRSGKEHAGQQEFAIALTGEANHLALSADGTMLGYTTPDEKTGESVIHVQKVGTRTVTTLPGTEGASYPFWSPDNQYVAFYADGKLKKVAIAGGAPQVLTLAPNGRGGSWGRKNVILFAPQTGVAIWRIDPDGTHAENLTGKMMTDKESSHRWPVFLPDGEHFLFWGGDFANLDNDTNSGIYLSSLSGHDRKRILLSHSNAGYANGQIVYWEKGRGLIAAKFDVSSGAAGSEKKVIGEGVGYQVSTYYAVFATGENGTVVYNTSAGSTTSVLAWYDRSGMELSQLGEPGAMANPSLSPDDAYVAMDRIDMKANNVDIWIQDVRKGTASRFTFDPAEEVTPTWSRDGQRIAYRSVRVSTMVQVKNVRGTEPEKTVYSSGGGAGEENITNSWSADDQEILCTAQKERSTTSLDLVAANGSGTKPFIKGEANYSNAQFSPDGKWVAYASNETGDWEIYVTKYPGAVGKWQVSRGGGTEPRWRGDRKELFYLGPHRELTAVEVNAGETFSVGAPVKLFAFQARAGISSTDLFTYDVTKDGKRFIVNRYVRPEAVAPLVVVLGAGE
ncbi:MAG TPA: protein kinase [Verrucomicrobiae bacterium]|nr:protein kinase [Verrucomicrobiae bacterium]